MKRIKKVLGSPIDPAVGKAVSLTLANVVQKLKGSPSAAFLDSVKKEWIPLAEKFGMWKVRYKLEDEWFSKVDPKSYKLVHSLLKKKIRIHEELFRDVMAIVRKQLHKVGISHCHILWRRKHTYGIYEKMQRKNQNINHINDFFAFRIIVPTLPDCYKALQALHYLWPPYPNRLKDYIKSPKKNRYQSIHTVLHCLECQSVEFQIRTEKMNYVAKYGPANHADYKAHVRGLES